MNGKLSAENYMNTILDDISAVIGLSATLKLVAWFGDGIANLYVPATAEEGQLLPKIIGLPAARLLSKEWPKKHLNIPRLHNYEVEMRKRAIARMLEKGYSLREVAGQLQMSERRVSQIKEELRSSGLLVEPGQAVSVAVAVVVPPAGDGAGAGSQSPPPAPPTTGPGVGAAFDSMVRGSVVVVPSAGAARAAGSKPAVTRVQGKRRR